MKTIRLSTNATATQMTLERERYEILKEITNMMFQDGITGAEIIRLKQVADMIKNRT